MILFLDEDCAYLDKSKVDKSKTNQRCQEPKTFAFLQSCHALSQIPKLRVYSVTLQRDQRSRLYDMR